MWNYYRNEKLTKQIIEGTTQTTGHSVLTSRSGCMDSQAACILVVFRALCSSYRCPLHRCPSWKCPASLLPSLRRWLLPRSAGFSLFHTSYCLMWSPAPLEGGSHGTFSIPDIKKQSIRDSWRSHLTYYFTGFIRQSVYFCWCIHSKGKMLFAWRQPLLFLCADIWTLLTMIEWWLVSIHQ